jgi:hypothetical protein
MCLNLIIARIEGGLGNQMFQYAAGKATALRLGVNLLLDTSFYNKIAELNGRIFMLNSFRNITEKEASTGDAMKLYPALTICDRVMGKSATMPRRTLSKILRYVFYGLGVMPERKKIAALKHPTGDSFLAPVPFSRVYFQRSSEYYADFNSIPDNTYMIGNWESEKFFDGIKTHVRSIYSFNAALYESPLYRRLNSEQSVSIHIRRGDKVNHKMHFSSDLNYVASAARVMRSKLSDPVFYVFSDEILWCKENLPHMLNMPLRFIEDHGIDDACKDMFFMSQCKHNIVGPSTFSWWAAWLNPNPNKIIVAPHQKLWAPDIPGGTNLLPQEWLTLE